MPDGNDGMPWLTALGFGFLTFNSAIAINRSRGDNMAIAFVSFSYVDLVALFCCLRRFEQLAPWQSRRSIDRMKMAVWCLSTLLTAMFCYKVAAVMPLPAAVLVWAMAGVAVSGFYAFFLHREDLRSRSLLPM